MDNGTWARDENDGTFKSVGEVQLRKYGHLLEEYETKLQDVEETFSFSLNFSSIPVPLEISAEEDTDIVSLVDTENRILNKIVTVFATLCSEVQFLHETARKDFINSILFYADGWDSEVPDGRILRVISQFLPVLQDLWNYVKHCEQVVLQIITQLGALHDFQWDTPALSPSAATGQIHLQVVFDELGKLLLVLATLDEAIASHPLLVQHFVYYKSSVAAHLASASSSVKVDVHKLKNLDSVLSNLQNDILSRQIFKNVLQLPFTSNLPVQKNGKLCNEFNLYLKTAAQDLESKSLQQMDHNQLLKWARLCCVCVFSVHLFGSTDKKLLKVFFDLCKKFHSVTLCGSVVWFPDQFLFEHLSGLSNTLDSKMLTTVTNNRKNYLVTSSQNISKEVQLYTMQVFNWALRMEVRMCEDLSNVKLNEMKDKYDILIEGCHLLCQMKRLVSVLTNLHGSLGKPMTKSLVLGICRLIELMKAVEHVYERLSTNIAKCINLLFQFLSYQILRFILVAKKNLLQDKKFSDKQVDILSSLVLVEKLLSGPVTNSRLQIIAIALTFTNRIKTFTEGDFLTLNNLLSKLQVICNLSKEVQDGANCDFLYWQVIIPIYFEHISKNVQDFQHLMYIFRALENTADAVDGCLQRSSPSPNNSSLDADISHFLRSHLLNPLNRDVETNLRLHCHTHLEVSQRTLDPTIVNYAIALRNNPAHLINRFFNIKGNVEHYLNQTFYDLTTVALHNWRTYGEMRVLGELKFNLQTVEDNLPSQTLEQGLDVLEIMRNIHIFVSRYLYNMNNQIFIEASSNNKHLNAINIRHIANSIRTHGTGIMSTTVNFTYQFLREKLNVFSQFLHDERIKSRLMKDIQYFRELKNQDNTKFPYDRAEKFNKGIRKLGVTSEGSYLDQYRILVSQIGNAMGYVRMIRSGGLHCCSNAIQFIPDLDDIVSFEELSIQESMSPACIEAAKSLDLIIGNMTQSLLDSTDYFKALVDVFSPAMRDPKNKHLQNFYIIIPPLTLNFIEHMINAKEKMNKKNKVGAAFTDDGFAMGVAYLLKVLDQYPEFDSLYWFHSVRDKYTADRKSLEEQKIFASKDDEKLQQTLNLTSKRLEAYEQEFELLYYNLNSARIFFHRNHFISKSHLEST